MLDFIIRKVFSARFLMALIFTVTACYAFTTNKLDSQAFMGLCGAVIHGYFTKEPTEKKDNEPKA